MFASIWDQLPVACMALFLFVPTQAVAPENAPSDAKPAYWVELSKPGDTWLFAKERGSAQYCCMIDPQQKMMKQRYDKLVSYF